MKVRVGARTDVGRVRERNEDGYLAEEPLFAVADGMGGHRAGQVASKLALEALAELPPDGEAHALPERVRAANRVVFQRAAEDEELEGMGTTLTALVVDAGDIRIAHVGDSRAYLVRDGRLSMITEDHTLVQRMVREGRLTPEQADVHPQRSILTRALGVEDEIEVDDMSVELQPGDRVLLCSDGLTSMLGDEEIEAVLREHDDPQDAADALVDAANHAGGQDNVTALVLDFQGERGAAGGTPRKEAAKPGADDTAVIAAPVEARERKRATKAGGGAEPGGSPGRRRAGRVLLWVGIVLVVLGLAVVGTKLYVDRQWYVGERDGKVTIFRGIPSSILGIELHTPVEESDIDADEARQLHAWKDLPDGITAESEEDARAIVEQIRSDVTPAPRPSPSPSPSPRATGSP